MLLTSPFLNLSSLKSTFPQNALKLPTVTKPVTTLPPPSLTIQAMKKLQGRVVKDANDKTVAVEVVRLAPHPKYKRRVRIKKRYQAHDPDNKFKIGDYVGLEKIRPISKTKTFLAVSVVARNTPKSVETVPPELLEIPLQSNEVQAV